MIDKKLLIVYSAFIVDPLIVESYNPLVSTFKAAFNVNVELIALSLTFHMLPLAIMCLFSGTLSDLYDRTKILIYGLLLSSIGSLLCALAPNIFVFLISRGIQGTGSALIMPLTFALIGDIVPRERIGKAMGIAGMVAGLFGVTLGPLLSGFIASIEWRILPFLFFVYCLIISVLCKIFLKGFKVSEKRTGSVTFVFHQIKKTIVNRNIALLSVTGFIMSFTFQGMMPFLADVFSLPPLLMNKSEMGIIFSIIGFVGILASFLGGFLADRLGFRKNMIFGFLLMMPWMFLLTLANSYSSYLILLSALISFSRFTNVSRSSLMVELMPEARGTVSSITNFFSFLGFAAGPIILTQIYVASGITYIFILNVFLLLACVVISTLIRSDNSRSPS